MKLRLTRDCRVQHSAGEIVEVSPVHAAFLLSTHSAVVVPEIPAAPVYDYLRKMEVPENPEKTAEEPENPEKAAKEPENPEKTAKAAKTTRKK
jgi:hypothetical protein